MNRRPFFYEWAVLLLLGVIAYERVASNRDKVETNEAIGTQVEALTPQLVELATQTRKGKTEAKWLTRLIFVFSIVAAIAGVVAAYAAVKAL